MVSRLVGLDPYGRRTLYFEHGRRLVDVDCVVSCTGYLYHQPFLRRSTWAEAPLFPEGPALDDLHEHVLYASNPSIAFVGLVKGGVPTFLLVQAQAALVSRVWTARRQQGPGRRCQRLDDALTTDELVGHPPLFLGGNVTRNNNNNTRDKDSYKELVCHELPYPKFMDYLLRLERTCREVDGKLKASMNRRDHRQNLPFCWTLDQEWVLQHRREIRTQFSSFNDQTRRGITSLQQLYRAPTEAWQALWMKQYEGVLPFLILCAGYFESPAARALPDLPRTTLRLDRDPAATLTYFSPAYLRTTSTVFYDCWRGLGCEKSRATLLSGARYLLEQCYRDIQECIKRIEMHRTQSGWDRPGLRDGIWELDALCKDLVAQRDDLMPLHQQLFKTGPFR